MSSALTVAKPADRSIELLDRVDYRLVETPADRDIIYRLRYRAYLNEGAIETNRDHKIFDRFDEMPNSWIFAVYLDGALASSAGGRSAQGYGRPDPLCGGSGARGSIS